MLVLISLYIILVYLTSLKPATLLLQAHWIHYTMSLHTEIKQNSRGSQIFQIDLGKLQKVSRKNENRSKTGGQLFKDHYKKLLLFKS